MSDARNMYAVAGRLPYYDLFHSKIPTRPLGVGVSRTLDHDTRPETVSSARERFRRLVEETQTSHRSIGLGTFHVACVRVGPAFETVVGWIRGGLEGGDDAMLARALAAEGDAPGARAVKDLAAGERAAFGEVLNAWRQDIASFKARLWTAAWSSMRSIDPGPSKLVVGIGGFGGALRSVARGDDVELDAALERLALLDRELEAHLRELVAK